MFPQEIVDIIYTHLEFKDIVSLSQAYPTQESTIRDALLKECPYYDINYSQYNSWRDCAIGYLKRDTRGFELDLDCPIYTDKPLPRDFHCFCKDSKHPVITYTDQGVFLKDKFVNLSETRDIPTLSTWETVENEEVSTMTFCGNTMEFEGESVYEVCTPKIMAAVSVSRNTFHVTVKANASSVNFQLTDIGRPILQIINDKALFSYAHSKMVDTLVITPQRGHAYKLKRAMDIYSVPAGVLFYDGCGFFVFLTKDETPFVSSGEKPTSYSYKTINGAVVVDQDDIYRQYALVFDSGAPCAVVDLKLHKVKALPQRHLQLVGVSGGRLRVWQYSRGYVERAYEKQHGSGLPDGILQDEKNGLIAPILVSE